MTDREAIKEYGRPVHPVCDLFPLMDGDDFRGLCNSVRENGLLQPVVIHEGQIIDGRNRLRACEDVGQPPRYVEWRSVYSGTMTVARWIADINMERRHMTLDQVLAVEVAIKEWEETENARLKQIEAGKRGAEGGRGKKKTLETDRSQGFSAPAQLTRAPQVRQKLAAKTGASERKAQQALNVQHADPALLQQVAQGTKTLLDAAKQVKAAAAAPAPPTRPKVAFDIERAIRGAMRGVDAVLLEWPDHRDILLTELIKTLEKMK